MNPVANNEMPVCPVCGRELPPHVEYNHCPRCLLRAGLASARADETEMVADPHLIARPGLPRPGDLFGHYQITRFLGEGGMGAVFEAEDLDSGRRVALKVIGHRLDSPEARRRFFREGRLAAAVNHPNSVYVFGTEEIAGVPVISMELASGGTLHGLVSSEGPLAISRAVDYTLQIMAGLEAAHRVGILHRDIKPSNCFTADNGMVKIGDYGLSISTLLRHETPMTVAGTFLGTPAFSSPEQLRGDELTVRSDIYSVGVTLYYLLTGHYPFEDGDMVRLMASVLERRAPPPSKWRADLPRELGRVVLRCLEKNPDQRFPDYAALRTSLLPFAPAAPTPATLGLRFLAGWIDALLLAVPELVLNYWTHGPLDGSRNSSQANQPDNPVGLFGYYAMWLAYYSLLDGRWGASIGKFLCGLRVVRLDRSLPGVPRALLRALVFLIPSLAVMWLEKSMEPKWEAIWLARVGMIAFLSPFVVMVLRFSTARRRNQFAGLHDLASGTRVAASSTFQARPELAPAREIPAIVEAAPLIGPYHVLDRLGSFNGGEMLLGFDAQLLRRVWIRKLTPGTPPVPAALRAVARPGRLRWLHGRRTDNEAWDIFESAPGEPLLHLLTKPQCWTRVRYWLFDLAGELESSGKDASRPDVLDLDRVWITAEGRAKLLDFPAPGTDTVRETSASHVASSPSAPARFLQQVATACLEGRVVHGGEVRATAVSAPLALHARRFLEHMTSAADLNAILSGLKPLLDRSATISRARRLALLAITWLLAFPLLALLTTLVARQFLAARLSVAPEEAALRQCLFQLDALQQQADAGGSKAREYERALEIYVAGRFAPVIAHARGWNMTWLAIPEKLHRNGQRILAATPAPSMEQFTQAKATVEPRLGQPSRTQAIVRDIMTHGAPPGLWFLIAQLLSILFVVIPCLVASLLFRGGVLVKSMGIAYVTRDGTPAMRRRLAMRSLIAWLPLLLALPGFRCLAPVLGDFNSLLIAAGIGLALALTSALLPQRSLQDRLTGLWPVPLY